jgi:transcriptional regulator with XRE-family HTH domain
MMAIRSIQRSLFMVLVFPIFIFDKSKIGTFPRVPRSIFVKPKPEKLSMESKLAAHFRKLRLEKGLKLSQLARLAGYSNISKGANRINAFERSGIVHADLCVKLADVLGIDRPTVDRLIEEDRSQFFEEWNAWANEPINPYLVIRLMAAIYCPHNLPEEIQSVEAAEAYGISVAKKWNKRCCLVLSRRISVWIAADGSIENVTEAVPGEPNTPFTKIGGKTVLSKFTDHGMAFQQIQWPQRGKS